MSHINERMGLRPAGKRRMMKLPTDRELRNRVTAARCPTCDRTGAMIVHRAPVRLFCQWCSATWNLEAPTL